MAVTANQLITRAGCEKVGYPVAASTTLYQGTLVFVNASGYVDDDTNSGANEFAGINIAEIDNSSGSNGDLDAEVWNEGVFDLTGSGFTQATVGQKIYASDNYTVTTTAAGNTYIGKCKAYVSSTVISVELDATGSDSDDTPILTQTGANALAIGSATDTAANTLSIFDGGADKPGVIVLYEADGTPQYLWVDADKLRIHTAMPTTAASDGVVVGTQT